MSGTWIGMMGAARAAGHSPHDTSAGLAWASSQHRVAQWSDSRGGRLQKCIFILFSVNLLGGIKECH